MARQISPERAKEMREERERQNKWDEVKAGPIGELFWMGDRPHSLKQTTGGTRNWAKFIEAAGLSKEDVKKLADFVQEKAESEVPKDNLEDYRHNSRFNIESGLPYHTKKQLKSHPDTPRASWHMSDYLGKGSHAEKLHELHLAINKIKSGKEQYQGDGMKTAIADRFMAELLGITVEQYEARKYKNSPGQMSLWDDDATGSNLLRTSARQKSLWDEDSHPRHPAGTGEGGQFAPREGSGAGGAEAQVRTEPKPERPPGGPTSPPPPKKPEKNEGASINEHGVPVITHEEIGSGLDGSYDRLHSSLASEIVQSKIAIGMKGIEGREYAIIKAAGGKYQLASRPGVKPGSEEENLREILKNAYKKAGKVYTGSAENDQRLVDLARKSSEHSKEESKASSELKAIREGKSGSWWKKFDSISKKEDIDNARKANERNPPKVKGFQSIDYEEREARDNALRLARIAYDEGRAMGRIASEIHPQDYGKWDALIGYFQSEPKKEDQPRKPPKGFNFKNHVKIAADSIESLRKSDVSRLVESTPNPETAQFVADEIGRLRPDLKSEADESIYDFMKEVGGKYSAVDAWVDRYMAQALGITVEQYERRRLKSSPGQMEFQWITVHPNGPGTVGHPVMISKKDGTIAAGMGGKFNGQKIGEIGRGKGEPGQEPRDVKRPEPATQRTNSPWKSGGDEMKWHGSRVRIEPAKKWEDAYEGTVQRVLNNGEIVEVKPDGQDGTFRVDASRAKLTEAAAEPKSESLSEAVSRQTQSGKNQFNSIVHGAADFFNSKGVQITPQELNSSFSNQMLDAMHAPSEDSLRQSLEKHINPNSRREVNWWLNQNPSYGKSSKDLANDWEQRKKYQNEESDNANLMEKRAEMLSVVGGNPEIISHLKSSAKSIRGAIALQNAQYESSIKRAKESEAKEAESQKAASMFTEEHAEGGKPLSAANMASEMNSSLRYNHFKTLEKYGLFTNGRFITKLSEKTKKQALEKRKLGSEGNELAKKTIDEILGKKFHREEAKIVGGREFSESLKGEKQLLIGDSKKNKGIFDSRMVETVLKENPGATMHVGKDADHLIFRDKSGETVGVVVGFSGINFDRKHADEVIEKAFKSPTESSPAKSSTKGSLTSQQQSTISGMSKLFGFDFESKEPRSIKRNAIAIKKPSNSQEEVMFRQLESHGLTTGKFRIEPNGVSELAIILNDKEKPKSSQYFAADSLVDRFMAELFGLSVEQYAARKVKSSPGQQMFDWITVHPNGAGTKGVPVMIDKKTGEIGGGMGGKFNGMKIGEIGKKSEPKSGDKYGDRLEAMKERRDPDGISQQPVDKAMRGEDNPKTRQQLQAELDSASAEVRRMAKSIPVGQLQPTDQKKWAEVNAKEQAARKAMAPYYKQDREEKEKAEQERRDKFNNAQEERIARLPTKQMRNGWELATDGANWYVRDPNTKEVIYKGKQSRARQVADEDRPEAYEEPAAKGDTAPTEPDDFSPKTYTPEESAKHRESAIAKGLGRVKSMGHVQTGAQAEQQSQDAWHTLSENQRAQFSGYKDFGGAVGKAFTAARDGSGSTGAVSPQDELKALNSRMEQLGELTNPLVKQEVDLTKQLREITDQKMNLRGDFGSHEWKSLNRKQNATVKKLRDIAAKLAPLNKEHSEAIQRGSELINQIRSQEKSRPTTTPAPAHPFAQSAMKGKIREASGQKMPGEESSSSWYETGKINNYSDDDIRKFYLGRALQTAGKLTARDFEKGFDSAINSAVSRGDVTDKIASAASAAFDRGKQQAGSKPAPAPSTFTPEMVPGQQASLFGGDDMNTGQKSLFNMVRPTKADQRAARKGEAPSASLLEQIDEEEKKRAESRKSLPGQRDMFSADQVDRFLEQYRAGSGTAKKEKKPKTVTGTYGDRGRFITVGEGDEARPVFLPGSVKKIKETGEYRTDNSQEKAKAARKKAKATGGKKFVPVTKLEKAIVEKIGDHPTDVREFKKIVDRTFSEMNSDAQDRLSAIREIMAFAGYGRNAGAFINQVKAARDYDKIARFDQMAQFAQREYPHVLAPKMKGAGGDVEGALFALLRDGIPEKLAKDSPEVIDAAWDRSDYERMGTPSEWEEEREERQQDDDFVPFSAGRFAITDRYSARVGSPGGSFRPRLTQAIR